MFIVERGRGRAAGAAEDHMTCNAVFQKLRVSLRSCSHDFQVFLNIKRASRSHAKTGFKI